MGFKAKVSRSVVVRLGVVDRIHRFENGGKVVPSLVEALMKSLGR